MTVYAAPGRPFEASVANGAAGLTGTLGVRISDLATDTDFLARTTAGITEFPASSGLYARSFTAPNVAGTYAIIWDTGGVTPVFSREDLVVTSSGLISSGPAPGDLTTLAAVKLAVTINGTQDDVLIAELISEASAALQKRYEREWAGAGTLTRRFRVRSSYVQLSPYDLRTVASLTLHPESTSPQVLVEFQDFMLEQASPDGTVWDLDLACEFAWGSTTSSRFGYSLLDIEGEWGCATVPSDVGRACIATVTSWMDRGAGQISGLDSDMREQIQGLVASWAIPAAAHRLCKPHARPVV